MSSCISSVAFLLVNIDGEERERSLAFYRLPFADLYLEEELSMCNSTVIREERELFTFYFIKVEYQQWKNTWNNVTLNNHITKWF